MQTARSGSIHRHRHHEMPMRRTTNLKTTNLDLQEEIIEELAFDPAIASDDVAVTVAGGVVTLRGTVPTLGQKWAVEDAVKRVRGVEGLANELSVDIPTLHARTDTDIALAIERRFQSNVLIPPGVQFMVQGGSVSLSGTVSWYYQSCEAENEVRRVTGVRNVFNGISIKPNVVVSEEDIARKIHSEFARAADLDANNIEVTVRGGAVTLTGTVRNWFEHDKATQGAWRVPGVSQVENLLTIAR